MQEQVCLVLILFIIVVSGSQCPENSKSSNCIGSECRYISSNCPFAYVDVSYSNNCCYNVTLFETQEYCFCDEGYVCGGANCYEGCTVGGLSIVYIDGGYCISTNVTTSPTPTNTATPSVSQTPSRSTTTDVQYTNEEDYYSDASSAWWVIMLTIIAAILLCIVCLALCASLTALFVFLTRRKRIEYTKLND